MDRKQFIFSYSGGVAAAWLLTSLQACSKAYYAATTSKGKQVNVALSEFATQDKNRNTVYRSFVLVKAEQLSYPIVVYRKSESDFVALYTECTHRGCELNPAPNGLQCPCHGSEFSKEGKVLNPPAEKDLLSFPVHLEKDFLSIQISPA